MLQSSCELIVKLIHRFKIDFLSFYSKSPHKYIFFQIGVQRLLQKKTKRWLLTGGEVYGEGDVGAPWQVAHPRLVTPWDEHVLNLGPLRTWNKETLKLTILFHIVMFIFFQI